MMRPGLWIPNKDLHSI